MKRWLVRICVFLLLGAIVNVAVAWGCAICTRWPEDTPGTTRTRHSLIAYPEQIQSEIERKQSRWRIHRATYEMWIDAHGLPGAALSSCAFVSPTWTDDFAALATAPLMDAQRDGIPLPLSVWEQQVWGSRQLPLRPLWPGFAINTVFYAFIVWLLFAGPFVVRRWRRIRRGLCPKCAYDLRGSADTEKCPECGSIVAS